MLSIRAYSVIPVAGLCALLSIPTLAAQPAAGGISLNQTRVIFLSTDKAQTLAVKNTGKQSYLIQSRVQLAPDNVTAAPFIVTPPVFPLKPDNRQLLRIIPQGAALPADRESLFYLSVLAIPAQPSQDIPLARVSMGMRFTIKLFYRPADIKTAPDSALCNLRLSQGVNGVRVENPTPYFQTFGQLKFNNTPVNLDAQPSMLAPLSTQNYPVQGRVTQAEWQTITDYGGLSTPCKQAVLSTQETP
ncbi:pilus assembly protein PapD [Chania multitudinisentens RB-25]|uniref:Pilus assembly protein PapD n=1 Tax=Chania multitudinisentens RB-25 TaxID=1441930 RepID=W0L562_9GAMM|nr:molecular chaperone [Chania multitudinisentens]AHG18913.1 pilus assembly protein PapD [Chania multitudinisentens RB-25]